MKINEEIKTKEQAEQLIEQLKNFKPKLEFNRWILSDLDKNWISFYDCDKGISYGVDSTGDWFLINSPLPSRGIDRYATEKEIHEKLLKYATENGYVDNLYGFYGFSLWYRDSSPTYKGNQLFINGSSVMLDGVWDVSQKLIKREISVKIPLWQLKNLRNYFGENDSSQTSHWAFKLFDGVLKEQ